MGFKLPKPTLVDFHYSDKRANIAALRSYVQFLLESLEYHDIEKLFPDWSACKIIAQHIPQMYIFGIDNENVIRPDTNWIANIILTTPEKHKEKMRHYLQAIGMTLSAYFKHLNMEEELEQLIQQPATENTLQMANGILFHRLMFCKKDNIPMPIDLVRHLLGLEKCQLK